MDKLRLIECLAPQIEQDLRSDRPIPCQSLWGLCADLGPAPSANDIAQARREEWDHFPRGDIE